MRTWLSRPAGEMARAIANGELSSRDLVAAHLEQIESVNPTLNAVVQLHAEAALAEAETADNEGVSARRTGATLGPLHGVPFTVKDAIATAGIVTTGGIPEREGLVPSRDATVVTRLRRAGAILLGKTNCPAFCAGAETGNPVYGLTSNPYDPDRSVASSSGGEAAIIAAGGSPFGLGSDTGGSIRFPAHFCGIAGLCPTFGRVPRTGHIPPYFGVPDTSVIGPLARYVSDLALVWPLLVGTDRIDPKVVPVPLPATGPLDLAGLRVAFHTDNGIYTPTDDSRSTVRDGVAVLEDAGVRTVEAVPPEIEEALALGQGISRVGWGHDLDTNTAYITHVDIEVGRLRAVMDDAIEAAQALQTGEAQLGIEFFFWMWKLDLYRSRMLTWMADFDAIVCPVMGYAAQPHGFSRRPDFSNLGYVGYTHPYSLLGWPSLVVRAGTSDEGLPIGVQIVARPWGEDVALALGAAIEDVLGGWAPPELASL